MSETLAAGTAAWGAQSMSGRLRRVLVARPRFEGVDPAAWHYGPGFDAARAADEHAAFVALLEPDATVEWLDPDPDLEPGGDGPEADVVFTHDPSLVTARGAVVLRMGKALREREPDAHAAFYARAGVPLLGRIEAPGTVEGGDCVWLAPDLLAVGRGVRTNAAGIAQLAALLKPAGVRVEAFDLPLWAGEAACLHLMSVVSPLAPDLALVHPPLLPVAFFQLLRAAGIRMVEGDAGEFEGGGGLNLNVLAIAPGEAIAVDGFPRTRAAMEAAGVAVRTFAGEALCVACEGGPTCLTRPVLRDPA